MGWYFNRWGKHCYREDKGERYYYGPKKKVWNQSCACPKCNTLNWAKFTADMYHLMPVKQIKYKCTNCKTEWIAPIIEGDYD